MKIRDRASRNNYKRSLRIGISLLVGVVVLFQTFLLYAIIQQNILNIGIATKYVKDAERNSFINQVVSKNEVEAAEAGIKALQQAGYMEYTYLLFLDTYLQECVIFLGILLVLGILLLVTYLRRQREERQELYEVIDWINGEKESISQKLLPKYVSLEIIQAIEKQKEKSNRQHIIQEEHTESIVKYMENISHQLKTPLAVIRATCERVSMLYLETEERMITCFQQVDKMTMLIKDFLQLGRFDCNKQEMKFEYILAKDLTESVVNELEELADQKNITIKVHGKNDIIWYCDVFWMEEILTNIVKNCVEYSEEGEINIYYDYSNNLHTVIIQDCGIGLADGLETRIFERYSTVKRINVEGSGLGLSIAQAAIKQHFGSVMARNLPKHGVEFRISFPQLDGEHVYSL